MPLRYLLVRLGLVGLVPTYDLRPLGLFCGVSALGYGLMLLAADGFSSLAIYRTFLTLMPGWAWALLMLLAGGLQVAGVALPWPPGIRYGSLIAVFAWGFTVAAIAQLSPRVPSLPLYTCLVVACGLLHVKG